MAESNMLAKVKLALRITHTSLDSDITDTIGSARAELVRAGVTDAIANGNSALVEMAIKTYCLFTYAPDSQRDGYFKSWEYQLENIRKSTFEVEEEE